MVLLYVIHILACHYLRSHDSFSHKGIHSTFEAWNKQLFHDMDD